MKPHESPSDAPSNNDERPTIEIEAGCGDLIVEQAIRALRRDPNTFQREGRLVHVVNADHDLSPLNQVKPSKRELAGGEVTQGAIITKGAPMIRDQESGRLWTTLSSVAGWEKYDGRSGKVKPIDPPGKIVNALLAHGTFPGIPYLVGITDVPILRRDGSVHEKPGYDPVTGYLYIPTIDFPPVHPWPTQKLANEARARVLDIFCDFPYATEVDRHIPLGALLSILGRSAILGAVPAFPFDANTSGAGKSLNAAVISVITTGFATTYPWANDEDEIKKTLFAIALNGARVVSFDNINGIWGNGILAKYITDGIASDRFLTRSETRTVPWKGVFLATGNNLVYARDLNRRILPCRIVSHLERPDGREQSAFKYPRLLAYVREHRAELVIACLTILRAYILARMPDMGCGNLGSFEEWADLIPPAIVFAGGANILQCVGSSLGIEDPEKSAARSLLKLLPALYSQKTSKEIKSGDIASTLWPGGRIREANSPPDGHDDLRDVITALTNVPPGRVPNAIQIGRAIGKYYEVRMDGHYLDKRTDPNTNTLYWTVKKDEPAPDRYEVEEREAIQNEHEFGKDGK